MNNFPEVCNYALRKGRPVLESSIFNWSIVLKEVDSSFWVCELGGTECSVLVTALTQAFNLFFFFLLFLFYGKNRKACFSSTWAYPSCSTPTPCAADVLQVCSGHCGIQINLRCWRNAGALNKRCAR